MSSSVEQIKSVIDLYVLQNFTIEEMVAKSYAPIAMKNGVLFSIIKKDTDQAAVQDSVSHILKNRNVKFKQIADNEFEELIEYIKQKQKQATDDAAAITFKVEDGEEEEKESENVNQAEDTVQESRAEENSETQAVKKKVAVAPGAFATKKIGEILVEMGFITQEQLFNSLMEAKKEQTQLTALLVQRKYITNEQLKEALTAQQGYEAAGENELKISDDVLSMLPEDFIRMNKVLPLSYDDKGLVVGMVNANDKKVINDIIFLTGLKPTVRLITYYEYAMCTQNLFSESKKVTSKLSRKIEKASKANQREETLFEQAQKELQDDSNIVVQFVNQIISTGIEQGVSDIHIEPRLEGYVVRYRKDGILREVLKLPEKSESSILTRLKVISKMNIAEHRRPQDGSFSITYRQKDYDFRINTLPVGNGEKMVIRILAPAVSLSASKEELNLIGASKEDIEIIKKMESSPNGIILATGPTGSGKTTTLYTLLNAINDEKINITTIEDPVEIKIDGINQSQINVKAGITFASCMRAILRQDPDVILVGEIRDIETLETAISAALTGHLVLSTLHTNSAASTVTRLIDMGAKDYLVSSTLVGIVAQRLVRHLCPHCKIPTKPTREEAEMLIAGGEKEIQEFMNQTVYVPGACDKCDYEGFKGRLGVYEIMPISKEIKKLISQGAHDIQIEDAAVGAGMHTLHQACLKHILDGETTISEFLRVLGPVKE